MEKKLRFFNIAGPCNTVEHYMLPALERLPEVHELIRKKQYFVLHAPRQSGKTTAIKALAGEINAKGEMAALYCSLERANEIDDEAEGISRICTYICEQLRSADPLKDLYPKFTGQNQERIDKKRLGDVRTLLQDICIDLKKPLAVFFDEIDCLCDKTLISFLRQLRDGYVNRDEIPFPSTIALIGLRNIRDYKVRIRPESSSLGSASPFNIITEASTLRNFTLEEVRTLYSQRTAETGQIFEEAAVERAYEYTCGQPWLVNALARHCTEKIRKGDDFSTVTAEDMHTAKEQIIRERGTHVDSLMSKMREERVRRVMEPVLLGELLGRAVTDDDISYVQDLGLLKKVKGALVPSNPMYSEIIFRYLSRQLQDCVLMLRPENPWNRGDHIDMESLMDSFQQFWQENAGILNVPEDFNEAFGQIMLQAFLQRVINGGGEIVREAALGKGALDILVKFQGHKYPVETKILSTYKKSRPKAHRQLARYLDSLGKDEGWMVIFDTDLTKPWEGKIRREEIAEGDKKLHLVFC